MSKENRAPARRSIPEFPQRKRIGLSSGTETPPDTLRRNSKSFISVFGNRRRC